MPTARYHALLCRDAAGGFSAVALDLGTTGFGASANDARDDLREFLRWLHRKEPWTAAPDFTEPQLRWFTVPVRPEYQGINRLYPTDAIIRTVATCDVSGTMVARPAWTSDAVPSAPGRTERLLPGAASALPNWADRGCPSVRRIAPSTSTSDPVEVIEMPEYARGIAAAYCDAPGGLETLTVPTLLAVSPTPADWSPERVASFYREYNDHMLQNLMVHEAMPGHYLQLCHERRFSGSSRVRGLCRSGSFVEVQGTAEGAPFDRRELDSLLDLAVAGAVDLSRFQREALGR